MIGWRLIKSRHADDPLSTAGAIAAGGRWNLPGTPLLYCSEHLSLAALEILVQLVPDSRHVRLLALQVAIPDDALIARWEESDLPPGWRSITGDATCKERGSAWASTRSQLVLSVPSAIVPPDRNLIVNGLHPAFRHVRVKSAAPFAFDPRLIPSPPAPSSTAPSRRSGTRAPSPR